MPPASLVIAFLALAVALASAQPTPSNETARPNLVPPNSSRGDSTQVSSCFLPLRAAWTWWYNSWNDGPYHYCRENPDAWTMLRSYRSGGTEGVHWRYTDRVNDLENDCLVDWDYYEADGKTLIAEIYSTSTTLGDTRRWCAMPIYRSGGVKGKQWQSCSCRGR